MDAPSRLPKTSQAFIGKMTCNFRNRHMYMFRVLRVFPTVRHNQLLSKPAKSRPSRCYRYSLQSYAQVLPRAVWWLQRAWSFPRQPTIHLMLPDAEEPQFS